ncbi:MAG: ribonuclease R family protein [Waddliaceae bacterium]
MLGKNFSPLTRKELMKRLNIHSEHRAVFIDVLKMLMNKDIAKFFKGRYYPKSPNLDTVSGVLRVHSRGFGFLKADQPSLYSQDIFVPRHLTQNAVDGDKVEVEVNPIISSPKGPEGRVVAILKRGRTHLAGIIRKIEWQGEVLAYAPILGSEQRVVIQTKEGVPLHIGDRVIMEVLDWGSKNRETACRVTHYLGHISDPSCDVPAAIEEYGLRADFPSSVIDEVHQLETKISTSEIHRREDFRDWECVTIDPDTARDFDDALSLKKDRKGHYHLGVHIADVSHFVRPDTALNEEAKARGNSTYFPGHCLPMLPPLLSENLCSLRPRVNRLTVSVLMEFDPEGELLNYRIVRAVIQSKKRLTYGEAKKILDGKMASPHAKILKLMTAFCKVLKKKRYERGSIEFALPDFVVTVNEEGIPTNTELMTYDITHQLVEEFMLKANEIVAHHLSQLGKDLTYRVHEEPAEENMKDFVMLAHAYGFHLPEKPSSKDLQGLFDEALQTPFGHFLAVSYIRRMRMALYSPDNIGHYGLGLTHYCHFTSPIRRYIDLVIHRILFDSNAEYENLENIAHHCSEQERISERAENSVVILKKLRLLSQFIQKEPDRHFEAVVTRVRNFGIYFEVLALMLEGFLHISELDDDFYEFDESKALLHGVHHDASYFAGDKIKVKVKSIDFIMQEVKWMLVKKKKKKL